MARRCPEQAVLLHPGDDLEHGRVLLRGHRLADVVRDREGVEVGVGAGVGEERRQFDRAPLEAELAAGGEVGEGRHLPDAVDVHCQFTRGEKRDRGGVLGIGRDKAVGSPSRTRTVTAFGELVEIVAGEPFAVGQHLAVLLTKQRVDRAELEVAGCGEGRHAPLGAAVLYLLERGLEVVDAVEARRAGRRRR